MRRMTLIFGSLLLVAGLSTAQTVDAYEDGASEDLVGLLDPSRFTLNHAVSFGMSSSSAGNGLKHQSLYTTMLQYQFSEPITVNVNFSLPIHSTYNSAHNFSSENMESAEYLRNIPFDASLTWQPSNNFMMRLSVLRNTGAEESFAHPFLLDHRLRRPYEHE
jgi:hypothetical protein